MTQSQETQYQAARAANEPSAPRTEDRSGDGPRPGRLVLAGAGSILAVLAFVGGMAVGHSWDGSSNQQGQFGGPGGGFRGGFPGQGNGTGQNGTGQNGTGQNGTGQNGSGIGQGNGVDPGQGSQQG